MRSIGRAVALVLTTGQGAPVKNVPKCKNAVSPTPIDSVKEDRVYISANPLASLLSCRPTPRRLHEDSARYDVENAAKHGTKRNFWQCKRFAGVVRSLLFYVLSPM